MAPNSPWNACQPLPHFACLLAQWLSATSSADLYDVGNGYAGGAPVFMERSIRESCFSADGGGGDGSAVVESNMGNWVEIEPAAMPWMYHYINDEGEPISTAAATREIETLSLFPTHSRDQEEDQQNDEQDQEHKYYSSCNDYYCTQQPNGYPPAAYYWVAGGQAQENYHHHYTANGSAASLELTLNSYYPGSI